MGQPLTHWFPIMMHFLDKISWYIRINIFLCPHYLTSYSCQYTSLIMTIFDFFLFAIILKLKLKYVFFPPLANGFNFCNSDLFYILFFLHLAKRYSFHFCSFLCVHVIQSMVHVLHQLPGSLTSLTSSFHIRHHLYIHTSRKTYFFIPFNFNFSSFPMFLCAFKQIEVLYVLLLNLKERC